VIVETVYKETDRNIKIGRNKSRFDKYRIYFPLNARPQINVGNGEGGRGGGKGD